MNNGRFPLKEISIEELFFSSENKIYEIPIYQRNYAWEKDEISALIRDIYDEFKKGTNKTYYIGTLVTFPKGNNIYEVIDGQQRLTTIRLILSAFKPSESLTNRLTYRARKRSYETIKNLSTTKKDDNYEVDIGIKNGYKYAQSALKELGIVQDANFINYFKDKVHIIHYNVPKDIDLNHYFEIMNSRGEQLEKHEIEKAHLMQILSDDNERSVFNMIWESCSNMSVYVQQSIDGINVKKIFGSNLHSFSINNFSELMDVYLENKNKEMDCVKSISIKQLVNSNEHNEWVEVINEIEKKDSHLPIIDFPNFLLIVLKIVMMDKKDFSSKKFNLDDKELLVEFKNANMNAEQVKRFAFTLLKARFILDNYIVHHSNENDTEDNRPWKLQVLNNDGKNCYLLNLADNESQEMLTQLLSMFEVSFAAKQRKNYLFYCLFYLIKYNDPDIDKYKEFVEKLANMYLKRVYLNKSKLNEINTPLPGSFDESIITKNNELDIETEDPVRSLEDFNKIYGDGTDESKGVPLFIFNYLDYLLWKKYRSEAQKKRKNNKDRKAFFDKIGCSDFGLEIFEKFYFSRTRRSLEHYYPQAIASGKKGFLNKDQINCFGNYAIIGSDANSSGSDWTPRTKLHHYVDSSKKINRISVASLKFWIMMKICSDNDNNKRAKGEEWNFDDITKHQKAMLMILLGK